MIHVTNCGHDSHHTKPCNIEHRNNLPDYLILLVKKEAWFYIEGKKIHTKPNMVVCFPPKSYIHYGCDIAGYNDDWIHFSIDNSDTIFFSELNIPMEQALYPYDFHRLSQYVALMSDAFRSDSSHAKEIVDSFMRIFFFTLQEELLNSTNTAATHKYYADFARLRTQLYNNPASNWSIGDMAGALCLSTSYFQHLYKDFFECSCQQDIIKARLDLAKFYLTNSEMSVRDVADFCGYENELHFMRQFKKFIGITPSQYRKTTKKIP